MKNIKTYLTLTAILIIVSACATQKRCSFKFPVQSSIDSVYVETIKKVSVFLPGDSILVNVPVNCPDQDLVSVETKKLKQQISILNGRLISNTNIKPDTVFIHTKETVTKTKEVKVLEPVRYVPKFFKFCTWGFVFIVLSIIVYFVIKYRIKLLSLIKK